MMRVKEHIRTLQKERDKYYVQAEVAKEQSSAWLAETEKLKGKLEIAVEALREIKIGSLKNGKWIRMDKDTCHDVVTEALSKILPPTE